VEFLLLLGGHPLPGRAKVAHQVVKVLGCFSVLLLLDQSQELCNGILSCLHRRNAWGVSGSYGLVCIQTRVSLKEQVHGIDGVLRYLLFSVGYGLDLRSYKWKKRSTLTTFSYIFYPGG
jgi:hypothetical protein